MTSADYFDGFMRALSQDRALTCKLDKILRRTQQLNIDFRGPARRWLYSEAWLLTHRLERRRDQIQILDMSTVDYATSAFEVATFVELNLANASAMATIFRQGVEVASVLDAEREPGLDALSDVVHQLELAAAKVASLAGIFAEAEREVARPLRVSQQLANFAARLLPWEERERYLNEYLSELDELAQDDSVSRRAQLCYALRLLVRTPALRLALRAPAQKERLPVTTDSR